ncbi:mCG148286 [Mus musculus]|nr:mCG148286 [Mus musculus]
MLTTSCGPLPSASFSQSLCAVPSPGLERLDTEQQIVNSGTRFFFFATKPGLFQVPLPGDLSGLGS